MWKASFGLIVYFRKLLGSQSDLNIRWCLEEIVVAVGLSKANDVAAIHSIVVVLKTCMVGYLMDRMKENARRSKSHEKVTME